jgi:hypothetical protein
MPEYAELLALCQRPFKWSEHEFVKGNIYVNVHSTIVRLNSLGVPWSLHQEDVKVVDNTDTGNKFKYDATCVVQLAIEGMGSRGAPGGHSGTDKSDTAKSAHSFALRKAASLFGIGHGLMVNPAAETAFVNFMASADLTDLTTVKKAIKIVADIDNKDPLKWMDERGLRKDKINVETMLAVLDLEGRI